jgi:hypothetical protein
VQEDPWIIREDFLRLKRHESQNRSNNYHAALYRAVIDPSD